ncbi:rhodanese-like domain-containing protein [Aliiroseovarius subalbicans]|uniref:rhodanese-like domain-containing protein n=1 Tax=Aliiroseovarius subalbicans TaxID=2925840 RepID=UPI001F574259|nr:rhodanese-like domain-containing protein [Aliiroseovarius subalbicans]MCI2400628.1 rhodanese-like domain-containing protein [Aliiroseovarius subalbicans]
MQGLTKRELLLMGGAATLGLAGLRPALAEGQAGPRYAHAFVTVEQMKAANALIVDIRRPEEWQQTGVIDGARLVTFKDPASFLSEVGPELTDGRPLVLICRTGNRTQAAASALLGRIPNAIVSAEGGMFKLMALGYQTVRPG